MNFSVGQAFPNYSGSIGGNGNITVRGGPVDPVEIPVEPAAAAGGCSSWTLSVREDPVNGWFYSVGLGLHNYRRSEAFDPDTNIFEGSLGSIQDQQVGLRIPFEADVNASGYVIPTAGTENNSSAASSIVIEKFNDYKFSFALPREKIPVGDVVMPIGSLQYDNGQWSVKDQVTICDNRGIFSPYLGYVIY